MASSSRSRGRWGSVLVGLALFTVTPTPGQEPAPGSLIGAARTAPIEFAMLLAHLSVPVGLEVSAADRLPQRMPAFDSRYSTPLPVAEAINLFNASHRNYVAAISEDVVVIRPVADRINYLDVELLRDDVVVTGAINALERIFSPIYPPPESGRGRIGSRLVDLATGGEYVAVRLSAGMTVLSALNDLAKQSRLGWVVETDTRQKTKVITWVGLLHGRGSFGFQIPHKE